MKKTILCFGDSNTWGFDAETGGRFDEDTRWTGVLAQEMGTSFRIIEEGLSGRTSVCEDPLFEGLCGLTYLYPCLMSHSPLDAIIIMLGTNDTKERFGLTSYNIAQGIVRLAQKAKQTPAGINGNPPEVIVIAPPPIDDEYITTTIGKPMGKYCSVKSREVPGILAELLLETGIHFIDAQHEVSMNEVDFMHLDVAGHRSMANLIRHYIERIFN